MKLSNNHAARTCLLLILFSVNALGASDAVDIPEIASVSDADDALDAANELEAVDTPDTVYIIPDPVETSDPVGVPDTVDIVPDSVYESEAVDLPDDLDAYGFEDEPDSVNESDTAIVPYTDDETDTIDTMPDALDDSESLDVPDGVDAYDFADEPDSADESGIVIVPYPLDEANVVDTAPDALDGSESLDVPDSVDASDSLDESTTVIELDTVGMPATFDEPGDKELSLEQARALALTSNLDIQSQMEAYWATSDTVKAETWVYEPEFQVIARQQVTDRDNNASQVAGTSRPFLDQEESLYNARLQNLLPSGGTIALDYRLIDRVNNQGGTNNILGGVIDGEDLRQFETFIGVTFTQPLLRKENIENLGEQNPQNPRVRIQLAKKTSKIAFQQVRRGLSSTISQVEVAYWNLYSALEVKKLREESLKVAKDIYEDNKERFRLGKMAKLELLESESEIAEREALLEEAIKRLHNARNELNTYFSQSLVCADFSFIPIDEPQVIPITQSCEEVVADSLLNHPEYLIRKEQAELEGLKLAYAENQRLPQLDLTLSYGYNGLGLTATEAWEQVKDETKADWLAGVQLNIPLMGDRKAYRQMSAAKRRKQQALMNLKSVEIQILNLTITTYKRLKSNFNTYQKASQVVNFREELLEAELVKLDEGKSSSREVFEIESELSDSKIVRLEKMVEYQKSQIELLLFQGTFLDVRDIDISEDQLLN